MKFSDYFVDGVAKDQMWIIEHREYLQEELHKDMREKGFIPVLDIDMTVSWSYDEETGHFKYRLGAKGQGVGRKKAKNFLGILSQEGIVLDAKAQQARVLAEI